jgi:hypothetical protein
MRLQYVNDTIISMIHLYQWYNHINDTIISMIQLYKWYNYINDTIISMIHYINDTIISQLYQCHSYIKYTYLTIISMIRLYQNYINDTIISQLYRWYNSIVKESAILPQEKKNQFHNTQLKQRTPFWRKLVHVALRLKFRILDRFRFHKHWGSKNTININFNIVTAMIHANNPST